MKLNKDITKGDILYTEQEIKESLERMNKNKVKENVQSKTVKTFNKLITFVLIIAFILFSFVIVPVIKSIFDYEDPIPATEKALEWVE